MKIIKEDLEFDEIYKGKVKPIATGGYIPFLKKFIGRIVHVIIPKKEKVYWLFSVNELTSLKTRVNRSKLFSEPYAKQKREEIINSINEILKHPEEFDIENLFNIVDGFGEDSLVKKIKKKYSI